MLNTTAVIGHVVKAADASIHGSLAMFIWQRVGQDWFRLERDEATAIAQLIVLAVMVVYSFLSWFNPGTYSPSVIGPHIAFLMTGYQLFNFYEDLTGLSRKIAERKARYCDDATRRSASVQRLVQRTIVMLFHHVVALVMSALLLMNEPEPDIWILYLYFGGTSELSTIFYTVSTFVREHRPAFEAPLGLVLTTRLQHATLMMFASTFVTVRVLGWTAVVLNNAALIQRQPSSMQMLFTFLSALQYYWGTKIVRKARRDRNQG